MRIEGVAYSSKQPGQAAHQQWRAAVEQSPTAPQLAIHIRALDSAILWEALKTPPNLGRPLVSSPLEHRCKLLLLADIRSHLLRGVADSGGFLGKWSWCFILAFAEAICARYRMIHDDHVWHNARCQNTLTYTDHPCSHTRHEAHACAAKDPTSFAVAADIVFTVLLRWAGDSRWGRAELLGRRRDPTGQGWEYQLRIRPLQPPAQPAPVPGPSLGPGLVSSVLSSLGVPTVSVQPLSTVPAVGMAPAPSPASSGQRPDAPPVPQQRSRSPSPEKVEQAAGEARDPEAPGAGTAVLTTQTAPPGLDDSKPMELDGKAAGDEAAGAAEADPRECSPGSKVAAADGQGPVAEPAAPPAAGSNEANASAAVLIRQKAATTAADAALPAEGSIAVGLSLSSAPGTSGAAVTSAGPRDYANAQVKPAAADIVQGEAAASRDAQQVSLGVQPFDQQELSAPARAQPTRDPGQPAATLAGRAATPPAQQQTPVTVTLAVQPFTGSVSVSLATTALLPSDGLTHAPAEASPAPVNAATGAAEGRPRSASGTPAAGSSGANHAAPYTAAADPRCGQQGFPQAFLYRPCRAVKTGQHIEGSLDSLVTSACSVPS